MNQNSSFVPTGPRNHQNNGAQHCRGNKNQHANANWNNGRNANGNNHSNANSNTNTHWNNNRNANGNQWNKNRNGHSNGKDANNHGYQTGNPNPNYKGKNFRPDFHRTRREDVSQSRVDQGVSRTSVGANPGPHSRLQRPRQNTLLGQQHQDYDIEMMDAPSYEPNDIEMPDAPPLFQEFAQDPVNEIHDLKTRLQDILNSLQRIEALTMGAYAVKEIISGIANPALSPHWYNVSQAILSSTEFTHDPWTPPDLWVPQSGVSFLQNKRSPTPE
ncbi:uncharacterized protein N7515_004740 [Penicillium bovifimosum]|uniref:Uncharacterized protein n=1 Tax=Penicillium bovifimosum TaxID=126998 RepID=A0A9W9H0P7_9EURO|nr:uncharacterized protein N7515_004740 [Penicillium bovifimosum]KAJ5135462.1 hypothetical protein N7515_004740 [Penicillium bovifimosum]